MKKLPAERVELLNTGQVESRNLDDSFIWKALGFESFESIV